MFKSHRARGFLICFGLTLLGLGLYPFGFFDALENKAIDFRFQVRGNRPASPDIVVVTIDESSIKKLGRWPWSRSVHGELIEKLTKSGARVVAFDSLFTEPDLKEPTSDQALVHAVKDSGRVVSAFFFKGNFQQKIYGLDPLFPFSPLKEEGYLGFVNQEPDTDGVCRHSFLYGIYDNAVYPSLAVAALAMSQEKSIEEILPTLPVTVNSDPELAENQLFINYAFTADNGEDYPYATYSYADVLTDKNLSEKFKDKIVFVGATAAALLDLKTIPFSAKYPGVMVHANVVDNLISGHWMKEAPSYVNALYILVLGLLLAFVLSKGSIWGKLISFVVVMGVAVILNLWLFSHLNLVLVLVPPLFVGFGSYGGILFYHLLIEEREKRKIKESFGQYLSPKIIDVLAQDPSKLKLGGEEREVSIFFLDIAGFTTMSEALKPTQLVEVMNQCLNLFSEVILKHDGLINKYIGDCIMAFWNAPADQPRHASQACLAALECMEVLPDLNRKFKEQGLPSIDCRIGINTGTVVVGNMGSTKKFDYTVLGDAVNLASRLEGANKEYHSHIMISDVTFEKAKADIEARDLDLIRVKGKKEPRKVFEVLGRKGQMSEELLVGREKYHTGLRLYREKKFDEAVQAFQDVFSYLPSDHLTRVYLERSRTFAISPPPVGWDGVFEMKTK